LLKLALKHQTSIKSYCLSTGHDLMLSCIFWIGPRNGWVSYLNYAVHIYCKLTLHGYIFADYFICTQVEQRCTLYTDAPVPISDIDRRRGQKLLSPAWLKCWLLIGRWPVGTTPMLKHDHQYRYLVHCLFFLHLLRCLIFFSLKKYVLRSPFHVECKALWDHWSCCHVVSL
jgi:hypothetical protein